MPKVRDPSMPLYVADWLSSEAVTAMSLEQQGAFLRLLAHAWLSGTCSLPSNDTALAALSTLGDRWLENSAPIRRCFKARRIGNEARIVNEKLLKVWKERRAYAEGGRKGGLKSGAARRSAVKPIPSQPPSLSEAKSNITSTSSSTSASTSSERSIIDVSLKRITPEVLSDTRRFLEWIADSAEAGACGNSEDFQIRSLALAARCLKRGKNPGALFVSMFKDGKFDHLNSDDIDEASRRIKELRGKPFGGIPELAGLTNFGRNPNL